MANQIVGRLLKVLPLESGDGKNNKTWKKIPFLLETEGEHSKQICMDAWGDVADKISNEKIGTLITANIDISSREYNGKYYTQLKVWNYSADSNAISNEPSSSLSDDNQNLPF